MRCKVPIWAPRSSQRLLQQMLLKKPMSHTGKGSGQILPRRDVFGPASSSSRRLFCRISFLKPGKGDCDTPLLKKLRAMAAKLQNVAVCAIRAEVQGKKGPHVAVLLLASSLNSGEGARLEMSMQQLRTPSSSFNQVYCPS